MPSAAKVVPRSRGGRVTLVSASPDTLEGLQLYLRAAGLNVASSRHLKDAPSLLQDSAALVLFPDDFEWPAVCSALEAAAVAKVTLRIVVVTQRPKQFEEMSRAEPAPEIIVVVKPAWSWAILDAIRRGPAASGARQKS
ncbi:MAG TPA: hypothetical protein VHE30_01940 [Polyangiaceae bacterium]|nr:hypothetical protein [Polyangiaceae bacterium]